MNLNLASFINLTKPRIVVLFAITGFIALYLEGSLLAEPVTLVGVILAMVFTAASANSLNMVIDRDIDSIMHRTRDTRALPLKKVTPLQASIFGCVLGLIAVSYLLFYVNVLTAALSAFTILFYVFIYTKWLKRTTVHNTLLGGFAGATAPLMAWAAATGEISAFAWTMFAIIFVWSPPHFWAICITLKDDYARAKIPMLPVVYGEKRTRLEILLYTIALIPVVALPTILGDRGNTYLVLSSLASVAYLLKTVQMMKEKSHKSCRSLFYFSIFYITFIFIAFIVDYHAGW